MILERESVSGQRQARPSRAGYRGDKAVGKRASKGVGKIFGQALALGVWLLPVAIVQSTIGVDIARGVHDEERLELRIREQREPPVNTVPPPRTNEESIDPWELVSV
jgi:hypothetical protein